MTEPELIDFFKSDSGTLFLLKTDRAGEEVDNGMGVDFDLKPYAVLTVNSDLKNPRGVRGEVSDEKIREFLMDKVMILTTREDRETVAEMMGRLADDGYTPIWTNGEYKYPDDPITTIERLGTTVSFKVTRSYTLRASFEEIKKYYETRRNPSNYGSDLFNYLLGRNPEHKAITDKTRFLSDSAKLESIKFDAEEILFCFECALEYEETVQERDWTSSPISKEKADTIQKKFEEETTFEEIKKFIEDRLK